MQTTIPPAYYYDNKHFEVEKQLFNESWQFVGFLRDLQEKNAYITTQIAEESVVVRKTPGGLRAFHNVCSHRFSRIMTQDKGKGRFQCPYHGWTYDDEGVPYAIPGVKQFCKMHKENHKLRQFSVDVCGEFVFVNKNTSPSVTLTDYLGALNDVLLRVSHALGQMIDCNTMTIAANWKIVVENTLESYHVHFVHPNSFDTVGITEVAYDYMPPHSSAKMNIELDVSKNKRLANAYASRPWPVDGYIHYLIFPNMTIASALGTSIAIQKITPIAPDKTEFTSYVFATTLDASQTNAIVKAFNLSAVDFNRRVFDEDKSVCEFVQQGIQETHRDVGPLHEDEQRVLNFQQHYMRILEGLK